MRTIIAPIFSFVICLLSFSVSAQVQWIADAPFNNTTYTSLYNMVADGNPVIVAIGDVHAQSSERLLSSGLMQKLASYHDAGAFGDRFSSKDLRVAFINVQVMANEASEKEPNDIQIINMNEGDETLNEAGWNALYAINTTGLFLITADHLVRPLTGTTADEIYAEVKFNNTKIRPSSSPDIRLLNATASNTGKTVEVRIQNFSTLPVKNIQISVMKNGQEIAQTVYDASIASLEDRLIAVNVPDINSADLTIIAKVDGDTNPLNNRWTGALRSTTNAVVAKR